MKITLADLFRLSRITNRQVVVETVGPGTHRIHHDGWIYTMPEDEDELLDRITARLDGGGGG